MNVKRKGRLTVSVRRFTILLIETILLGFSSISIAAEYGPYYLSSVGYCNIRKFYLSTSGLIYGTEVGCTSSAYYTFIGFFDLESNSSKFSVSRSLNSTGGTGSMYSAVYDLYSNNLDIYDTDGLSITSQYYGLRYVLTMTPPSGAFASSLPDHDALLSQQRAK